MGTDVGKQTGSDWPEPRELMLHRPPMLLLDRIAGRIESGLIAEVDVNPNKAFYDAQAGGIPAWVGVEYMAQTIAAYGGLVKKAAGQDIELGMLVSCRNVLCQQPVFANGVVLSVTVSELAVSESGMAVFACQITAADNPEYLLTQGQLGVFQHAGEINN